MSGADLTKLLEVISLLGAAALVAKLFFTGLWKRYPVFFAYFIFRIPDALLPLLMDIKSQNYQKAWMLTEPIAWIFHVWVVVELYRLVLERYKGIYTLGRWMVYGALAIAIPLSLLSLIPHFKPKMPQFTRYMGYEFGTARGIDFALALFLLLILLLLSRYPITLSRNLLLHSALYTLFFLGGALTVFLRTLFGIQATDIMSLSLLGLSCACIGTWLVLLNPRGEEVQAHFLAISPEREKNALRQLEALNATLLRASGK